MGAPTISLRQQADAVKLAWANKRGHAATLRGLVEARKRPPEDLAQAESQLPLLFAAAVTLNDLALQEAAAAPPPPAEEPDDF